MYREQAAVSGVGAAPGPVSGVPWRRRRQVDGADGVRLAAAGRGATRRQVVARLSCVQRVRRVRLRGEQRVHAAHAGHADTQAREVRVIWQHTQTWFSPHGDVDDIRLFSRTIGHGTKILYTCYA